MAADRIDAAMANCVATVVFGCKRLSDLNPFSPGKKSILAPTPPLPFCFGEGVLFEVPPLPTSKMSVQEGARGRQARGLQKESVSPGAQTQFGWSMAATRGHKFNEETPRGKLAREGEKKREILDGPALGCPDKKKSGEGRPSKREDTSSPHFCRWFCELTFFGEVGGRGPSFLSAPASLRTYIFWGRGGAGGPVSFFVFFSPQDPRARNSNWANDNVLSARQERQRPVQAKPLQANPFNLSRPDLFGPAMMLTCSSQT